MDNIILLEECVIKVEEEIKEEICDITECVEYDALENSPIKTDYSGYDLQVKDHNESEEEVKPSIAVFLRPTEEMEERTEEQEDPLALNGDPSFIASEERETGFSIPDDPDNERVDDPSSKNDSRPRWSRIREPLRCKVCHRGFNCKSVFAMHIIERDHMHIDHMHIDHMHIERVQKPYQCPVCHISFLFEGTLAKHLRRHAGEKPFECKICGKRFSYEESLQLHVQTVRMCRQIGNYPFCCSICGKSFASNSNLAAHFKLHTRKKSFQCSFCKKYFSNRNKLLRHTYRNIECIQQRDQMQEMV